MVKNKLKTKAIYLAFLLPALSLYALFALVPLIQGVGISTSNWDGVSPWVQAQIPIKDFEQNILPKLNAADADLLKKYYLKNIDQEVYQKQELVGLDRYRVMSILDSAGYSNEKFKNVGLSNYANIFSSEANKNFMPSVSQKTFFKSGDDLSNIRQIEKSEFEKILIPHIKDLEQVKWLQAQFDLKNNIYELKSDYFSKSEVDIQVDLSNTVGLQDNWEEIYKGVIAAGETGQNFEDYLKSLNNPNLAQVKSDLELSYNTGKLKVLIADNWYKDSTNMGVLLFTIVFVVCNVLLVNFLALGIALALDQKIKSRNMLRGVFYIPNVLSMIIVAFIWQIFFDQFLPAITGQHDWLNNSDKAPWLTILIATWQGMGYYMVIYLAGLQSVPTDILESASIDGAPWLMRFRKIILPMLMPAITICLFLSLAGALKTFDILFALYGSSSSVMGVENISVNIYWEAFREKNAGFANAKAVLFMFVIMIISGIQLIVSKRKEVEL